MYRAGYPRVTHPSATQSPDLHPKNQVRCFVRLACVRHAASVHPEPGSNSQIKCLRCQIEVQNHWFFSCLYCLFRFWTFVLFHGLPCRHHSQENPNENWINVQGCFVIQLSRFCFHVKAFIFYHIAFYLSRTFLKTFFHLLFEDFCSLRCELLYVITCHLICQDFFNFLLRFLSFFFQKCVSHVQRIL